MLTLIAAQRFEDLQASLLAQLMQPGADPLQADTVLVPSTAVRRALSLALADACGVCAQVEFSFLAQWLWARMAALVPGIPVDSPFDPDRLRWRVLRILQQPAWVARHGRLQAWLQGADAVQRFALAGQLAALFDQYITYRGDWLDAWAAGRLAVTAATAGAVRADEAWQAALWRAVLEDVAGRPGSTVLGGHPVQRFLARLAADGATTPAQLAQAGLPAVVHVFALPSLPPLYLQALAGLAGHVEVRLYVLDPCREYWLDLVSARQLARLERRGEDGYHEVGHRLLTAWGGQTQAFMQLLLELDPPREEPVTVVTAGMPAETPGLTPGGDGGPARLLTSLQAGMVALQDLLPGALLAGADAAGPPQAACAPDGTLQVHVCHSRLRELEILHDHLLRCFAADATLRPQEVLVVLPDLDLAAPLIEAVFGVDPAGRTPPAIPFVITGLAPAASSPQAQALLAVLAFARSRLPLSGLLELLHQPLIAQGFGLDAASTGRLAACLRAADVHWGLDGAQLRDLDLPEAALHTLEEGLARLLLGFALPDRHAGLWQGRLPVPAVEGADALVLGTLHTCVQRLSGLRAGLAGALTPADWLALLEQVLAEWLPAGAADMAEQAALRADLRAQQQEWQAAGQHDALPAEVLLQALQERLAGHASGGVPTGAVTFAAMPSLRGLPFRVLAVLGLDDGVFPGVRRPPEFDLLAAFPRLGDRQRGEDQRNLFLDLVLAARDQLYLSYSGRSARDGSERPPSVLLAELLDAVVPALCPAEATPADLTAMRARLLTVHALQPFDARYFLPSTVPGALPASFQTAYAAAARAQAGAVQAGGARPAGGAGVTPPVDAGTEDAPETAPEEDAASDDRLPPFFLQPLAPPEAEWRTVSLAQLQAFVCHPARYLLRERLGLVLPARVDAWLDAEAFLPRFDATATLADRLLPALLAGATPAQVAAQAAAGSEFPPGALGAHLRAQALAGLDQFARRVRTVSVAPVLPARSGVLAVDLAGEPWTLTGSTDPLRGAQVSWHYRPAWVGDELGAWIRHLWLALVSGQSGEPALDTLLLCRQETLRFPPVDPGAARTHLTFLLEAYRAGLRQPLHFYPRTARALVTTGTLKAAQAKWTGQGHEGSGERADPWWQLALRGVDEPLDSAFVVLAEGVWQPLLAALQRDPA